jgi:hypothetical protein
MVAMWRGGIDRARLAAVWHDASVAVPDAPLPIESARER